MIYNNNLKKKNISIYDLTLGSSIITNVSCFLYIQQQNKLIKELIENNKDLTYSINRLNRDVAKMGEEIVLMQSKSTPIFINTTDHSLFYKTFIVVSLTVTSVCLCYYVSSALLTKISSLALPKIILPKIASVYSYIEKIPFFDQTKEISVFLQEIAVTVFIELLNGEVSSINFRQAGDDESTPIIKALEFFIESKKELVNLLDEKTITSTAETVTETLSNLTGLF